MDDPKPLTRFELAKFLPNQRAIKAFEKIFDIIPSELNELIKGISDAINNAETASSRSSSNLGMIYEIDPAKKYFHFISKLSDLPRPLAGVISLSDAHTYYFTKEVDLHGNRLLGGVNSTILGSSSENSRIKSTGLAPGTALLSSAWTLPIRHITLEAPTIINLDATANTGQALDWYGVNFQGSSDIGIIKNYSNFVVSSVAFLGASGLIFDGIFGTISFSGSIFVGDGIGEIIKIADTATIQRRFRISYSAIVVLSGNTGINASVLASIPVEGYIYDTCNFSGSGIFVSGVSVTDNKSRWVENRGINNTFSVSGYYMQNNAIATIISIVSTPVKVAGVTTESSVSQRFSVSNANRATYVGAIQRRFKVSVDCTLTSGNNNQIGIYLSKNGLILPESEVDVTANAAGRFENAHLQILSELNDTDYIEVFVENKSSATDIVVKNLNLIVEALT